MADSRDSSEGSGINAGEPRAGDVIAGRVSPDQLDAATVAQLASWFGAPAADMPPPAVETPQQRDRRELRERRQRATEAVDLAFVDKLESRRHAGDPLIRLPEPMTLPLESPLTYFQPEVWRLRVFDVRDWEVPEDLSDAMEERTPQAVLRDLHRPILQWSKLFMTTDLGLDVGGARSRHLLSSTVRTRYQVRMAEWPRASAQAITHMAELRSRLHEPWGDIDIPEERRGRSSTVRTAEDLRWFGDVAYDPSL